MKKKCILFNLFLGLMISTSFSQNEKPNILLITLDDMNWDSPASFGGFIPDLTPNIDAIAKIGVQFNNAFVQAPNCSPSRAVIQTGLYPHQTGTRGFFYVKDNFETLPEILKENGYYTGVINKVTDTNIHPDFNHYWHEAMNIKGDKRDSKSYGKLFHTFISKAKNSNKPFYCVVNIADPHKPFYNDDKPNAKNIKEIHPSKIYGLKDIKIPDFLPDNEEIKNDVLNYYNSVKRGDDCVGEIIAALEKSKIAKNTIIIILSDHGASFPFAKSSIYLHGIKTPLIIAFPKAFKPKSEVKSIVSSIDLAPTILDITSQKIPKEMVGNSFYEVLTGKKEQIGTYVFAQFDENAGGVPRPSRTVLSKKYGYIFNPWATGKYPFVSAASYDATYKAMQKMSKEDENVAKRFNFWKFRTLEEFYDYENDPNALNNLIDDPKYKELISEFKQELKNHMKATNDYVLSAFENMHKTAFLDSWMQNEIDSSIKRQKTIKWKREKNQSGSTKNNIELFDNANQQ
ncbi:sulfatase family protein [Polaribacter sp.]|uniref:sulfatase family protein n=1 Tax=Polaribacter sp. TaxID=1920175 RepID=UPI004048C76A